MDFKVEGMDAEVTPPIWARFSPSHVALRYVIVKFARTPRAGLSDNPPWIINGM